MSNRNVLIKLLNQYHYSLENEMFKIEEKLKEGITCQCGEYLFSPPEKEHFAFFMHFYGLNQFSKFQLVNSNSDWLDLTDKVPLFANDVVEIKIKVGTKEIYASKNNLEMMNYYSVSPEAYFTSENNSTQMVEISLKLVKEGTQREEFKKLMFDPGLLMNEYQTELSEKFKSFWKNERPLFKYTPAFFKERLKFWDFEAEENQVEKYLGQIDLSNFNVTDVVEMTRCLELFFDPRLKNEEIVLEMKRSATLRKRQMEELIKQL